MSGMVESVEAMVLGYDVGVVLMVWLPQGWMVENSDVRVGGVEEASSG